MSLLLNWRDLKNPALQFPFSLPISTLKFYCQGRLISTLRHRPLLHLRAGYAGGAGIGREEMGVGDAGRE